MRHDALVCAAAALLAIAAIVEEARDAGPQAMAASVVPGRTSAAPSTKEKLCEPLTLEPIELLSVPDLDRPVPPIEDDTGEALAAFYGELARLARGRATDHLRIGWYADSNGTYDFITGEMRRVLQGRWGDAGHGWIAMARAWPWYRHRDVEQGSDAGWTAHAVSSNWVDDRFYGHGLVIAESHRAGATTWIATASPPALIGRTVSRVEIAWLRRPGGGTFDVVVDDHLFTTVETDGAATEPAWTRLDLQDAPHTIACIAKDARVVRLLGATMERAPAPPSVVVDALSVGGVAWRTMLRDDPGIDAATLRHRAYDLLVVHIGTNTWNGETRRAAEMREQIDRLKTALPDTPILVLDPPDGHDDVELMDGFVPREQRKIAKEKGAAFFDFHAAMGGAHSMDRFWVHKMALGDLVHFNEAGGAYMARRVLFALWRDFARWLAAHPRAGCD